MVNRYMVMSADRLQRTGNLMLSDPKRQPQPSGMTLDAQLCFAVYSASNAIDQMYRPLLEKYGLTYTQYIVLMTLAEEDNVSISVLAGRIGVSGATMTPLLRRLEDKNLLMRRTEAGNERRKNVVITPAGRALFEESCVVTETVFCATGLSQKQAGELIRLCRLVTAR